MKIYKPFSFYVKKYERKALWARSIALGIGLLLFNFYRRKKNRKIKRFVLSFIHTLKLENEKNKFKIP